MTFSSAAKPRLVELIKQLAVVHGKVTLSSGIEADYYVDLRRATLHHELLGTAQFEAIAAAFGLEGNLFRMVLLAFLQRDDRLFHRTGADLHRHRADDGPVGPGGDVPVLLLQPGQRRQGQVLLVVGGASVGGRRVGTDPGLLAGLCAGQDHGR